MKDYYQILGLDPQAEEEHIRKKYRQLAMQYHPDRNPDDPQAADRFKEIAEAYGVLTDPVKRTQYDAARQSGGSYQETGSSGGFDYSQEDILKDLFRDPHFQQMFHSLLREFQRSGFRASPHFVRQSFFGGKGGFLLGGLFLFGRLAGPALYRSASKNLEKKPSLLKDLSNSVKSLLSSNSKTSTEPQAQPVEPQTTSIEYTIHLTEADLQDGKVIQVVTSGPGGQEVLKVKIPPGSRAGQKLRLRGKGQDGPDGRGDLFILLERTTD